MKAVDVAMQVYENKTRHIPTRQLNDYLLSVIEKLHLKPLKVNT